MNEADVQRDLGRFEAKISALEISVEELRRVVSELNKTLNEARGSWRMLMILGGASSIMGAMVHKYAESLIGLLK